MCSSWTSFAIVFAPVVQLLCQLSSFYVDCATPTSHSQPTFHGQLGQDEWVLSMFDSPRFYLDVGANDGQDISNTKVLDDRGWKGICVDPFPKNFDSRTCHWVRHAVHSLKHEVSFTRADIFGGIKEHFSSSHAGTVNGAPEELLEAKVLAEILEEADAPTYIDYFSLDTEGSEEEILRSFPFNKYAFGAITVEHNHEEPKCANIRSILEKSGYSLAKEVNFDDWYVNNIFMPVRGSKAWVKFNQTLGSIGV